MPQESFKLKSIANLAPLCAGVIDGSVYLMYYFSIDNTAYYGIGIVLKIFFITLSEKNTFSFARSLQNNLAFYLFIALIECLSVIANNSDGGTIAKTMAFIVNMAVTAHLLSYSYWWAIYIAGIPNLALYLHAYATGALDDNFGRLLYFEGQQPNLGGEIFMSFAYASVFLKPNYLILALNCIALYCANLLQARAGELSIIFSTAIVSYRLYQLSRYKLFVSFAVLFGFVFSLFVVNYSEAINSILLLDDENRGVGTDASGRSRHWASAIGAFISNPIFGAGADYSSRLGVLQPHSFFLYPIASYGVLGFILLVSLIHRLFYGLRISNIAKYIPFVPMVLFGDRFINLNIYPSILFYLVIHEFDSALKKRVLKAGDGGTKLREIAS